MNLDYYDNTNQNSLRRAGSQMSSHRELNVNMAPPRTEQNDENFLKDKFA